MEELRNAMFACVNILSGILTLSLYGAVIVTLHDKILPDTQLPETLEITVVPNNTHSLT